VSTLRVSIECLKRTAYAIPWLGVAFAFFLTAWQDPSCSSVYNAITFAPLLTYASVWELWLLPILQLPYWSEVPSAQSRIQHTEVASKVYSNTGVLLVCEVIPPLRGSASVWLENVFSGDELEELLHTMQDVLASHQNQR